ncbi:MAG TPA: LytTR family DNA-binding domain-containing protein [Puia sp.]|nr:LytTR family DNA-binding domain-containing protein [Puia sp.]
MKFRCLIVDDEPPAIKVLLSYMENMENLDVAGTCFNALEAMQVLQQQPVDLIFLDIRMPRLLGTEFIRTLRNPPRVIFTTAHKDYAVEGFDLDAVDYLLKPFSFERFLKAINKIDGNAATPARGAITSAADRSSPGPYASSSPPIIATPAPSPGNPFLYFRVDRKMTRVELDEILYIESMKDYSRIVQTIQKPLVMKKSISSIEEMLPEGQFIRIHRSFIVAIQKVTAYTQHHVEVGDLELPIGKIYRHQLSKLVRFTPPGGSSPGSQQPL